MFLHLMCIFVSAPSVEYLTLSGGGASKPVEVDERRKEFKSYSVCGFRKYISRLLIRSNVSDVNDVVG